MKATNIRNCLGCGVDQDETNSYTSKIISKAGKVYIYIAGRCKPCNKEFVDEWIKENPKRHAIIGIRWRKKMIVLGRCVICAKKAVNKRYCEKHRINFNKVHRIWRKKKI